MTACGTRGNGTANGTTGAGTTGNGTGAMTQTTQMESSSAGTTQSGGGKTGTADISCDGEGKEHLWAIGGSTSDNTPYVVGVCLNNQPWGTSSSKAGAVLNQIYTLLNT